MTHLFGNSFGNIVNIRYSFKIILTYEKNFAKVYKNLDRNYVKIIICEIKIKIIIM